MRERFREGRGHLCRVGAMVVLLAATALGSSCADRSDTLSRREGEIVYGQDDRLDYFQLTDPQSQTLMSGAMVALVANDVLSSTAGDLARAPTWGATADLCPGEPFADQPAAVFCSGVLVDWDLVLTADHCTRLYNVNDFKIVFGYYETAPGQLAFNSDDVFSISEIVDEELDPEGSQPRLDYAWLRLEKPVRLPRQPVMVSVANPALEVGAPVISVSTPGGIPVKWDAGGQAQDVRADWLDYFVTDSDNSAGSSGGGGFDERGTLLGITARGGMDFVQTTSGCNTTVRVPDGSDGQEQFTYAFQTIAGLCGSDGGRASTLCRGDCGSVCRALPPPAVAAGCSVGPRDSKWEWFWTSVIALFIALLRRRIPGKRVSPAGSEATEPRPRRAQRRTQRVKSPQCGASTNGAMS
jgi:hypothetical protein